LTPDQKKKIQEIRKQMGVKTRDLRKLLKEKRGEMRDAMFDPNVTDAQLREKHKEVSRLHQRVEQAMFDDFLSIRAMLTPEQRKHLPEVKPPLREPPGAVGMRQGLSKFPAPLESKGKSPD
jgi:Spy/CpxP family protein refolding chaperone